MKGIGKTYQRTSDEYFGTTDNKKFYDIMTCGLNDLPEADKWKAGQEYDLKVRAKLRSKKEGEDGTELSFELVGVSSLEEEYDDETPEQKRIKKILE